MGLSKRRLYKPERRPARKRGVLEKDAPLSVPDASRFEIASAIFAIAKEAGVKVGRGSGYDPLRDEYTVIGKSTATGKAQDFKIAGSEVANAIVLFRYLNGGKARPAA